MVDHRAIMSLLLKHRSYTEITASAKCSRRDVSAVKKAIESAGITAERFATMGAADIAALFPDGAQQRVRGVDPARLRTRCRRDEVEPAFHHAAGLEIQVEKSVDNNRSIVGISS